MIRWFHCVCFALHVATCCAVRAEIPRRDVVTDTVDVLERNRFYNDEGGLVFEQLIAWDWNDDLARYDVVAWRMIDKPSRVPKAVAGGYEATFFDGDLLRTVQAPSLRETWTQYDPELVERDELPKEQRRELTTVRPWVKRRAP